MASTLNTDLLASMLKSKRGNKGLRAISAEIGNVSISTLSRIEQGKIPNVDTFIKICSWLDASPNSFVLSADRHQDKLVSNKEVVIAHLRAEKELDADTVDMIVKLVNLAYTKRFKSGG